MNKYITFITVITFTLQCHTALSDDALDPDVVNQQMALKTRITINDARLARLKQKLEDMQSTIDDKRSQIAALVPVI